MTYKHAKLYYKCEGIFLLISLLFNTFFVSKSNKFRHKMKMSLKGNFDENQEAKFGCF